MVITDRYYPYPVLGGKAHAFSDGCVFDARYAAETNSTKAVVKVEVMLQEPTLQGLIESGEARLICHVECAATAYRRVEPIMPNATTAITLHAGDVAGHIEMSVVIVADKDIAQYGNQSLIGMYKGRSYSVDKGGLLAVAQDYSFDLNLVDKRLRDSKSPVVIAPDPDNNSRIIRVDCRSEEICVYLPVEQFKMYKNLDDAKSVTMAVSDARNHELLVAMVIVPALVQVFCEIAMNEIQDIELDRNVEEFSRCAWYAPINDKIREFLRENNVDGDLSTIDFEQFPPLVVAQYIAKNPICDAFKKLGE